MLYSYKKKSNNDVHDYRVKCPANHFESSVSESMNKKKYSIVNTEDHESFVSETISNVQDEKEVDCEANRPTHDLESAASDLKAVEEVQEKLFAEKNELLLTLQSKNSMVEVKQIYFSHFFYEKYCRM